MKNTFKLALFLFILAVLLPNPCSLHALSLDETLTTLNSISQDKTMEFRWDPLFQDGEFKAGDHYGAFSTTERKGETGFLVLNNRELFTIPLPYNNNGSLDFPEEFVITLKNAFSNSFENELTQFRIAAIIIDPGHGGRDPGTINNMAINGKKTELVEKDIVLNVGKMLKTLLDKTYPEKRIIMTRSTDVFYSLEKRADIANAVPLKENEAVIFISIHANWGANANARGYEVWHINSNYRRTLIDPSKHNYSADIMPILNAMLEEEYATESILLADSILRGLTQTLGSSVPSRGRKANDWFVVKNSRMPAVLVELGFVSNIHDAVLMTSAEGLQKLTESLYTGIVNYISVFERL